MKEKRFRPRHNACWLDKIHFPFWPRAPKRVRQPPGEGDEDEEGSFLPSNLGAAMDSQHGLEASFPPLFPLALPPTVASVVTPPPRLPHLDLYSSLLPPLVAPRPVDPALSAWTLHWLRLLQRPAPPLPPAPPVARRLPLVVIKREASLEEEEEIVVEDCGSPVACRAPLAADEEKAAAPTATATAAAVFEQATCDGPVQFQRLSNPAVASAASLTAEKSDSATGCAAGVYRCAYCNHTFKVWPALNSTFKLTTTFIVQVLLSEAQEEAPESLFGVLPLFLLEREGGALLERCQRAILSLQGLRGEVPQLLLRAQTQEAVARR